MYLLRLHVFGHGYPLLNGYELCSYTIAHFEWPSCIIRNNKKKKINKNKKNPTSSVISRESSEMLTVLFTISSALTKLPPQPPPIRNEISLPTIRKHGDVRVPWAMSPWLTPGGSYWEGRTSAPPIHQSPCCSAGSLPRAVGLSPKVGWLSKAVPVFVHPPIPSSKSKLHAAWRKKTATTFNVFL